MSYHDRKAETRLAYRIFYGFVVLLFLTLVFSYFFGMEGRYCNVLFEKGCETEIKDFYAQVE